MTGQIARFEDAICPAVYGLNGQARETVGNRMRQVAASVGLRVASASCRPNLLLMVTRDKRAFLGACRPLSPIFRRGGDSARAGSIAQPGPVAAWQAAIELSADGQPLAVQGGFGVNRTTRPQSHIAASTRPVFTASAVVVESDALTGLSTIQLADYALMRGLARTDPHRLPANDAALDPDRDRGADGERGADHHHPLGSRLPARPLRQPGQSPRPAAARRHRAAGGERARPGGSGQN